MKRLPLSGTKLRKERRRVDALLYNYTLSFNSNKFTMNRSLSLALVFVLSITFTYAKEYKVISPDGKIALTVEVGSDIRWNAIFQGKEIINSPRIAMLLADGKVLGLNEKVRKAKVSQIDEIIKPIVANKRSEIRDNCNVLEISFRSGFLLQFRAYNDGVAYRFETAFKEDITVKNEISDFQFPSGSKSWYPLEASFMSHNERTFIYSSLDTIGNKHLASLPTLFKINDINVLLTESDIEDYPGMWLVGSGSGKISGTWPKFPDKERLARDRDVFVTGTKDYISSTKGTRTFPWRAFVIADTDIKLIESDLVFKLAKPNKMQILHG
jgi:alpha-glucosidase